MLAIISRKGVYIAHYWENIAFSPDARFLADYGTPEKAFEETVTNALREGIKDPYNEKEYIQMPLREYADKYVDDHIYAYLIRPRIAHDQDYPGGPRRDPNKPDNPDQTEDKPGESSGGGSAGPARDEEKDDVEKIDGYPKQWQEIKDIVLEMIPKLKETDRWRTRIYDAIDDENTLEKEPNGRVLFKFDPEHKLAETRKGKPTKLTKMWLERREIHSDEWTD
jgi:hypothetical protein